MRILATSILFFVISVAVAAGRPDRGITIVEVGAEKIRLYNESHALVIGVSDYQTDWPDLPGVLRDVQLVENALTLHGFKVIKVLNPNRRQLEDTFNTFINKYGQDPGNRLLFYFAGHGHTMKLSYGGEMGYIVPQDAPSPEQDKSGFLAVAMDMQMIEVYARRIQAKHALFMFDSCFSGSIFSKSRSVPENISYKTTLPVRQFLTSGSADEEVPDESIFRHQFIAALSGEGDLNKDSYVTGAELGEFLQNNVVNYSRGSQHPQYGKIRDPNLDKGDFVFQLESEGKTNKKILQQTEQSVVGGDPEHEMWKLVQGSETIADVEMFLSAYPNGRYSAAAKLKIEQLRRKARTALVPKTYAPPQPLARIYSSVETTNTSKYIGNNRWDWTVYISADQETLNQISCVEYTLHPTFPNPVRTSCDRGRHFALSSNGWGVFEIQVRVLYQDQSERKLTHMLEFR